MSLDISIINRAVRHSRGYLWRLAITPVVLYEAFILSGLVLFWPATDTIIRGYLLGLLMVMSVFCLLPFAIRLRYGSRIGHEWRLKRMGVIPRRILLWEYLIMLAPTLTIIGCMFILSPQWEVARDLIVILFSCACVLPIYVAMFRYVGISRDSLKDPLLEGFFFEIVGPIIAIFGAGLAVTYGTNNVLVMFYACFFPFQWHSLSSYRSTLRRR